jgi:hypothetical protein
MTTPDNTVEWQQYLDGQDYNTRINLYENVNKNERFYAGDQWAGVVANGLPTPVFNIFKRIINYFIASILSQNVAVQFTPENVGDDPSNPEEIEIKEASELITQYSETLFEKLKMTQKIRQWLLDAALSGDAAAYNYFDMSIETMQAMMGDICIEEIDSVNIMFGNPNDKRVQKQPYIIIAFRQLVADLKKEAELYKIPQARIDLITPDVEYEYQAGDRSKIEMDNKGEQVGKCQALLKLWKKDGKVLAKKTTRYTDIRPQWDTKLSCYPVAWMNWDPRKNSYHGQAVGTGLVPNQIFINKMFAMAMMSMMHTAFPKLLYNKSYITAVNNQVGAAIGADVGTDVNISNIATYLNPGNMSNQVFELIDKAIQYTKDMLGASDAALGDVKPENTSAIIAIQQAAAVPLETIKQNLYQFIEDIGYIWLDFMANYYGKRKIDVMELGKRVVKEFDFSMLKKMKMRIKIDVGPSSYWSQITAMQTLDHLLEADRITFKQYLDRLPSGQVPKTQELIKDIESQDVKQQFIWEQMAKFMDSLPPDQKAQIEAIKDPQQMEDQVMQMMMQPQPQAPPEPQVDPAQVQAQQTAEQQAAQQQHELVKGDQQAIQQVQMADAKHQQDLQKNQNQFHQQVLLKQMDHEHQLKLARAGARGGAKK